MRHLVIKDILHLALHHSRQREIGWPALSLQTRYVHQLYSNGMHRVTYDCVVPNLLVTSLYSVCVECGHLAGSLSESARDTKAIQKSCVSWWFHTPRHRDIPTSLAPTKAIFVGWKYEVLSPCISHKSCLLQGGTICACDEHDALWYRWGIGYLLSEFHNLG